MKTIYWLTLVLRAMNIHSAEILKELECHDKVVQHGIDTLSFAQEVNSLFVATNVDHFISSFGSKKHTPIWNSVTYFAGRYALALQVPISIDYQNCKLNGATGEAVIQVNETIKVEVSRSGIAGATEKGQWRLNENQWKRFVNNKGDWSVVNVPILTNVPVNGFDEFVRQAREPIRNRKEGFDQPVRQASKSLRDRKANLPDANEDKRAQSSVRDGAPSNELDCQEKVVRHGRDTLILPGEVNSLFGATNVDHFISKFGSKTQIPVWHSVAYFAGRYRFVLQVPISVDYEECRLKGAMNSATVQIDEITSVDISKPGTTGARTKGQWRLGQSEWKWLVKNNGNWSVVKVPIRTDAPVKGFGGYVRQERGRPLRDRQEDFDKPIRRAIEALSYPSGGPTRKDE